MTSILGNSPRRDSGSMFQSCTRIYLDTYDGTAPEIHGFRVHSYAAYSIRKFIGALTNIETGNVVDEFMTTFSIAEL